MKKEKDRNIKLTVLSIVAFATTFLPCLVLLIYSSTIEMDYIHVKLARIVAVLSLVVAAVPLMWVNINVGYYKCSHCGEKFIPSIRTYSLGVHVIGTRYLTCPKCGKSGMFKKTMS